MTARFKLPKTPQTVRWVHATDALREHLKQRLATVRQRADQKRKEADEIEAEGVQLEQAIALLDQLLPPKQTPTPITAAATVSSPSESDTTPLPKKPFSMMYDSCQKCHRGPDQGVRHAARGLCQACYWNETHPKSDDKLDQAVSEVAASA
jgi:hypothetical protein